MEEVGVCYHNGEGTSIDLEKALEMFTKASELNSPAALNNLASMYRYGEGVPQDYEKAAMYYKRAAKLGIYKPSKKH